MNIHIDESGSITFRNNQGEYTMTQKNKAAKKDTAQTIREQKAEDVKKLIAKNIDVFKRLKEK